MAQEVLESSAPPKWLAENHEMQTVTAIDIAIRQPIKGFRALSLRPDTGRRLPGHID